MGSSFEKIPRAGASGRRAGSAERPMALSPSRAGDFMRCPLLYRFRVIDKLPEKPSAAATRGTVVHAVLERLFDAPAAERTAAGARAMVPDEWEKLLAKRPELAELFEDDPRGERLAGWLGDAERLVERWFTLEDPTRLEPADRELYVETVLDSGLTLRGFIDRVDVAPSGEVRLVDYKTGKAPAPRFRSEPLFQMQFYALVMWRLRGVVPRRLQLVYLGSGDVLTYDPGEEELRAVERKLLALWEAIALATETGDWRPKPSRLCGWCDHQAVCPEFGGTPPPYPLPVVDAGAASAAGTGFGSGAPADAEEAVPDAGAASAAEARSGAGTDAGVDAGAEAGADAGAEAGLDAGAVTGVDAGAEAGAGVDAEAAAGAEVGVGAVASGQGAQGRMGQV